MKKGVCVCIVIVSIVISYMYTHFTFVLGYDNNLIPERDGLGDGRILGWGVDEMPGDGR
jgi:hypothetical protein